MPRSDEDRLRSVRQRPVRRSLNEHTMGAAHLCRPYQGFGFFCTFTQGFASLHPYRSSRVIHDWRGEPWRSSPQPIVNNSAAPNFGAVNKIQFLRNGSGGTRRPVTNIHPRHAMSEPRFSLRAVRLGFNESSDADARRLSIRFSLGPSQRIAVNLRYQ